MNLEQIDTSTTAGKAEVMRLAAEGRRVAFRLSESRSEMLGAPRPWQACTFPTWNWISWDYAIIAEPVGPEELWVFIAQNGLSFGCSEEKLNVGEGETAVRYRRADLAGEKG